VPLLSLSIFSLTELQSVNPTLERLQRQLFVQARTLRGGAVGDDQLSLGTIDALRHCEADSLSAPRPPSHVEHNEQLLADRRVVSHVRVDLLAGLVERDEFA